GLAEAGQERARGRIAPDEHQRPAVPIDAAVGKRRLMTEIEQAFMDPPLRRLRRHTGHLANFRGQPKIEPTSLYDHTPCRGDQHYARTQAEYPEQARTAEPKRGFDKSI